MKFLKKQKDLLRPDIVLDTVADLDLSKLPEVKVLAFDADSTLVEANTIVVQPDTLTFLQSLNLPLILATNRPAPGGDELAKIIGAKAVIHATLRVRKPNAAYFRKITKVANAKPQHIAMIGDRLFTDIYGANRAGFVSIYVRALGKDPWYLRYTGMRLLENIITKLS